MDGNSPLNCFEKYVSRRRINLLAFSLRVVIDYPECNVKGIM